MIKVLCDICFKEEHKGDYPKEFQALEWGGIRKYYRHRWCNEHLLEILGLRFHTNQC